MVLISPAAFFLFCLFLHEHMYYGEKEKKKALLSGWSYVNMMQHGHYENIPI